MVTINQDEATFANKMRTSRRKVTSIKKSVYVNIPSKLAKELGITKGIVLDVTLEGNRIIFSREKDEVLPARTEPIQGDGFAERCLQ